MSRNPAWGSARCLGKHSEHGKYQRLSLEIVFCSIAGGAIDLFPYLREPRKPRQVCVGIGGVGAQTFPDPAIDAVDEGGQQRAIAQPERISERMQFTRI